MNEFLSMKASYLHHILQYTYDWLSPIEYSFHAISPLLDDFILSNCPTTYQVTKGEFAHHEYFFRLLKRFQKSSAAVVSGVFTCLKVKGFVTIRQGIELSCSAFEEDDFTTISMSYRTPVVLHQ